jgi:hypothetical protein
LNVILSFWIFFSTRKRHSGSAPRPDPESASEKQCFFFFFPRKSPVFYKNNSVLLSSPPSLVAGRGAVLTFVILPLHVYVFSASEISRRPAIREGRRCPIDLNSLPHKRAMQKSVLVSSTLIYSITLRRSSSHLQLMAQGQIREIKIVP